MLEAGGCTGARVGKVGGHKSRLLGPSAMGRPCGFRGNRGEREGATPLQSAGRCGVQEAALGPGLGWYVS